MGPPAPETLQQRATKSGGFTTDEFATDSVIADCVRESIGISGAFLIHSNHVLLK